MKTFNYSLFAAFTGLLLISLSVRAESLADAFEIARQNNALLKLQQARIQFQQQELAGIKSRSHPQLSLVAGASYSHRETRFQANVPGLGSLPLPLLDESPYFSVASISLPLTTFGKLKHAIDAQQYVQSSSEHDYQQAWQDLNRQIAQSYIALLRNQQQQKASESTIVSLKDHYHNVQQLYQQGLALETDLLASESALSSTQIQHAYLLDNAINLQQQYNLLLGRDLETPVSVEELPAIVIEEALAELLEKAIAQAPELAAMQARLDGLSSARKSRQADSYPDISLVGSAAYIESSLLVDEYNPSISLLLNWRYGGQSSRSEVGKLSAQNKELRHARHLKQQQLTAQLQATFRAHQLSQQATDSLQLALKQAGQHEDNIRNRYRNGLATQADFLSAHAATTSRQQQYLESRYNIALTAIDILSLTGELESHPISRTRAESLLN